MFKKMQRRSETDQQERARMNKKLNTKKSNDSKEKKAKKTALKYIHILGITIR